MHEAEQFSVLLPARCRGCGSLARWP